MDPEEIENRQFLVQLRGYARDEVETFREEVAQEIKILRKQLTKATSDLSHANSELANVKSQLADASAQLAEERSKPAPKPAPEPEAVEAAPDRASMFHMVGQETERILLAAEEAAEQIHEQAVKESAELMADTRMRIERSLAEFEAARRAAEEDFAGIQDSRTMVASQLEDIRRRLEETISRLRIPVELPGSKPASRFRPKSDAPERAATQPPAERRPVDPHAQRQREIEAARELQARQTAHRGEANRREAELKAVQAEAELRARGEAARQARERAAAEVAARKAQQAADLHAAVAAAQDADRVQAARESERLKSAEAERLKSAEAERLKSAEAVRVNADATAKARADEEAARQKDRNAEAERVAAEEPERAGAEKAEAESAAAKKQTQAENDRAAEAEMEPAKAKSAESGRIRKPTPAAQPKEPAPTEAMSQGEAGSSLDALLAEIRRKREEEGQSAQPQTPEPAAPQPAAAAHEMSRRSEALGDLPAQTARRLKRLLQEEHNDLLDRLRTQRGKGDLDDNLAPQSEQLGRFVSGLSEALGKAFSQGREVAGSEGSSDPSAAVTRLVTRQVLKPLRSEITKAIQAGLEAQDSAASLSERANDVFRVWKGVRTQLLGEGIAYAAYHQGLVDAWGSRAGATKSWVFSADEQNCPDDICRRNADAGAVGVKAPFPSGHLAPPAHGGCTCTLAGS